MFEAALDAWDAAGVPYLLGGAFAFNAYTDIWRDTKDLDAFVRPADSSRALEALDAAGFDTGIVYPSWLGKGWQGDVFVDVIWRNANGLLPTTDEWFRHGGEGDIFGRPVPILSIEDLILSKIMVGGRYRWDGGDLVHLLFRGHDRIDWDRLAAGAGEHVELLLAYLHMFRWAYPAWRSHVPDDIIQRFQHLAETVSAAPSEPFRGSLLDIPTFRVDVDEWGMPDPHARVLDRIREGGEVL